MQANNSIAFILTTTFQVNWVIHFYLNLSFSFWNKTFENKVSP